MESTLRIILRIIHVFAGVAWAGGTFLMVSVIGPTASETRPESNKVMGLAGPRFRSFATLSGTFSLLSGLILFWFASGLVGGGFSAWISIRQGMLLTIGTVSGLIAFIYGVAVVGPITGRVVALGQEIAKSGGQPSPEQGARMAQLQQANANGARIVAILLVITIIGMAGAGI